MTRRALVIKTGGNQEIAQAIVDGIATVQNGRNAELEAVRAELERMKQREAALGVREVRDRDYWHCKAQEAEYYYGDNPHHGKAAEIALGVIGLVCVAVNGCFKYLQAWNREG